MIDKELFERYKRALSSALDLMGAEFDAMQIAQMSASELKAYIREAYPSVVKQYGSFVAVATAEFYNKIREMAAPASRYDASAFEASLGAYLASDAARLVQGVDIEAIASNIKAQGAQRALQYADETLYENARADPARPKWALVPSAGACGWCQLIASRGFDYASEEKVDNTRHPHCRCIPVVDFDTKAPSLDGYDPDALLGKYKKARDEVDKTATDEWNALTDAERAQYGSKSRGAFDHFKRNRIADTMGKM